jgi:hypothetical protein
MPAIFGADLGCLHRGHGPLLQFFVLILHSQARCTKHVPGLNVKVPNP